MLRWIKQLFSKQPTIVLKNISEHINVSIIVGESKEDVKKGGRISITSSGGGGSGGSSSIGASKIPRQEIVVQEHRR